MKKTLLLLLVCLSGWQVLFSEVLKTVKVETAGTLSSLLTSDELTTVTDLTVTGSINATDFATMKGMSVLAVLDLSGVTLDADTVPESGFYPQTTLTKVTLPSTVTSIGQYAFRGCTALDTINFPEGLKSIGKQSFRETALKHVVFPSTLVSIQSSFYRCYSLESATFSAEPVTLNLGGSSFYQCTSLTDVDIPSTTTAIGSSCFRECKISSAILPASITTVESSTFYGCANLTSIAIPEGVTTIGASAFYGCTALVSATLPSTLTSLSGSSVFYGCSSLKNSTLPSKLAGSIGTYVFQNCSSLESVIIPQGVTTIGSGAFSSCTSLKLVHIAGASVSLSSVVFSSCTALKDFYADMLTPPSMTNQLLSSVPVASATLYVPHQSVDSYKAVTAISGQPAWSDFSQIIGRYKVKYSIKGQVNDSLYVNPDSLLTAPADPTKEGYTFSGWYADTTSATAWNFAASTVTADTTLYAVFKIVTGMDDIEKTIHLSVYPNPVSDALTISGLEGKATLLVTDLSGAVLINRDIIDQTTVSVSSLEKGMYLVRVGSSTFKIIKK
jgi:uncharacterized repeat protein (TIGR02543 family)